jgi:hypothetical protein
LKAEQQTVSLTIQVPVKKYRILMEMAREAKTESLTFIKGETDFCDCDKCRITCFPSTCAIHDVFIKKQGVAELACYGAFMRFLFSR